MAEEQQQEVKEYVITKIAEDGRQVQDKTSEDYTGRAQVQYPNGDVYDGTFLNGVRDGRGTMTYAEQGTKYEGEWKNNLKEGIGKMTFGTEGEYTGHFVAGQRSGEGVYKYLKTKDLYSGSWKNGLKHGKGTFIFFDTKMKIVGDWFNGQIMKGKWIFANGTYFEGKFENNYPKGEGVWHFANGNVIKGEFTHELKEIAASGKQPEKKITVIDWKTEKTPINREIYV
jgi:hypothetical protein